MIYLAHTKDGKTFISESECQELKQHLENTARYAKEKASAFDAAEAAEMIGLLHDVGKYSISFQRKIRGESHKSTGHAMAGAYIMNEVYSAADKIAAWYGIVIGSHHTGLNDFGLGSNDDCTYCGKLNNHKPESLPYADELLLPSEIIHKSVKQQKGFLGFQIATYLRMLLSVLVDADFTDTEEFCNDIKRKTNYADMSELFERLIKNMPQNSGGNVNNVRSEILNSCLSAAEKPQGLFSLTAPTGGGKTLSSLAFALRHAVKHGLRRIIYVIPYTSIIEQNADVIKEKLGKENVLEHHSGIVTDADDFKLRWATENWDIPIVITTNVQFFESLFANKTTDLRKIHNIAKSVIIFDEVQTLPRDYVSPCMSIISELIKNYGVTGVLCSATQPCVQKYAYKSIETVEMINNPQSLAEQLKRVNITFAGKKSDNEIISELNSLHSALVVVNTRKHAFTLYNLAKKEMLQDELFYLSTLLVPAHRSRKIREIKERLEKNLPVKVISTQLIEAGVDVDFPVVYRSIAGIDSIIQAGGRANREGKLKNDDGSPKLGEVIIFEPCEESGKTPKSLMNTVSIGKEVISVLKEKAFTLESIKKYFELLYFTDERGDSMDKKGILSEFEFDRNEIIKMNFKTVADKFNLIEENRHDVIIECRDDSRELIKSLRNGTYTRDTLRKLQKYSISIYSAEFHKLRSENAIQEVIKDVYVLVTQAYYSYESGLDLFTGDNKNGQAYFI